MGFAEKSLGSKEGNPKFENFEAISSGRTFFSYKSRSPLKIKSLFA
jgi:hypothetical protein